MAKKLDLGVAEGAFVEAYDEAIVLESLKDLAYVGIKVLCGLGEDDVIYMADAERETTQEAIQNVLEGRPSVTES